MDPPLAQRVAKLRALGFSQTEIAREVGVSQQTVSRYLRAINEAAEDADNRDAFLLGLLLGGIGVAWFLSQQKK